MSLFKLFRRSGSGMDEERPDPTRRRLLTGLGVAACAASVGVLSFDTRAEAATSPLEDGDLLDRLDALADGEADEMEVAHYTGYRHNHYRRRRRRHRRGSCRDRWFRRRHPRACGIRTRRRHRRRYRRDCYRVGHVTVCR
ncbi:hypothetical protein [Jiella avicenniae]|uniref:Protamine-2 (Modular protein) n=1 Tax=Jiella avicenniae TaxID=2907202 RepID=A0A9X1NWF6_9HYPH|nr:hypothetical protein [Jiella avicenniae]MCE7026762.1 hypothetical protein [Jiella avicenniae]